MTWYCPPDVSSAEKKAIYAAITTTENCVMWMPYSRNRASLVKALCASLQVELCIVAPKAALAWWKETTKNRKEKLQIISCSSDCAPSTEIAILDLDEGLLPSLPTTGANLRCIGILSTADTTLVGSKQMRKWLRLRCVAKDAAAVAAQSIDIIHVPNRMETLEDHLYVAIQEAARHFNVKIETWNQESWDADVRRKALEPSVREAIGTKEVLLRLCRMRQLIHAGNLIGLHEFIGALPVGLAEQWYNSPSFVTFCNAVAEQHRELGPVVPAILAQFEGVEKKDQMTIVCSGDVERVSKAIEEQRMITVERMVRGKNATSVKAVMAKWRQKSVQCLVVESVDLVRSLVIHGGLRSCDALIMAHPDIPALAGLVHQMDIGRTVHILPEGSSPTNSIEYLLETEGWEEKDDSQVAFSIDGFQFNEPKWPLQDKDEKKKVGKKKKGKEKYSDGLRQQTISDFFTKLAQKSQKSQEGGASGSNEPPKNILPASEKGDKIDDPHTEESKKKDPTPPPPSLPSSFLSPIARRRLSMSPQNTPPPFGKRTDPRSGDTRGRIMQPRKVRRRMGVETPHLRVPKPSVVLLSSQTPPTGGREREAQLRERHQKRMGLEGEGGTKSPIISGQAASSSERPPMSPIINISLSPQTPPLGRRRKVATPGGKNVMKKKGKGSSTNTGTTHRQVIGKLPPQEKSASKLKEKNDSGGKKPNPSSSSSTAQAQAQAEVRPGSRMAPIEIGSDSESDGVVVIPQSEPLANINGIENRVPVPVPQGEGEVNDEHDHEGAFGKEMHEVMRSSLPINAACIPTYDRNLPPGTVINVTETNDTVEHYAETNADDVDINLNHPETNVTGVENRAPQAVGKKVHDKNETKEARMGIDARNIHPPKDDNYLPSSEVINVTETNDIIVDNDAVHLAQTSGVMHVTETTNTVEHYADANVDKTVEVINVTETNDMVDINHANDVTGVENHGPQVGEKVRYQNDNKGGRSETKEARMGIDTLNIHPPNDDNSLPSGVINVTETNDIIVDDDAVHLAQTSGVMHVTETNESVGYNDAVHLANGSVLMNETEPRRGTADGGGRPAEEPVGVNVVQLIPAENHTETNVVHLHTAVTETIESVDNDAEFANGANGKIYENAHIREADSEIIKETAALPVYNGAHLANDDATVVINYTKAVNTTDNHNLPPEEVHSNHDRGGAVNASEIEEMRPDSDQHPPEMTDTMNALLDELFATQVPITEKEEEKVRLYILPSENVAVSSCLSRAKRLRDSLGIPDDCALKDSFSEHRKPVFCDDVSFYLPSLKKVRTAAAAADVSLRETSRGCDEPTSLPNEGKECPAAESGARTRAQWLF